MPASSGRGNTLSAEALPAPNGTAPIKTLTVDGTVRMLTDGAFVFAANTEKVLVQVEDADVWVTWDGSTPSTSNGFRLFDGYLKEWNPESANAAKFLRATATSARVRAGQFVA